MPLQLREYQKNDFIALKNIIRKTWRYDEFSSPKTASRLADVFLSSCLTNYTFSTCSSLSKHIFRSLSMIGSLKVMDFSHCPFICFSS